MEIRYLIALNIVKTAVGSVIVYYSWRTSFSLSSLFFMPKRWLMSEFCTFPAKSVFFGEESILDVGPDMCDHPSKGYWFSLGSSLHAMILLHGLYFHRNMSLMFTLMKNITFYYSSQSLSISYIFRSECCCKRSDFRSVILEINPFSPTAFRLTWKKQYRDRETSKAVVVDGVTAAEAEVCEYDTLALVLLEVLKIF